MAKTKDERYEAFMEYLDEEVHDKLSCIVDYIRLEVFENNEFYMNEEEIIEFIDAIWHRCFDRKKK